MEITGEIIIVKQIPNWNVSTDTRALTYNSLKKELVYSVSKSLQFLCCVFCLDTRIRKEKFIGRQIDCGRCIQSFIS